MDLPAADLVKISEYLDYIPIGSSISNSIHLIQKITKKHKKNEYEEYVAKKEIVRCILLIALPGIANLGVFIYDNLLKPRKIPQKDQPKQTVFLTRTNNELIEKFEIDQRKIPQKDQPKQTVFLTGTNKELIEKFEIDQNILLFNQLDPKHLNDQEFMKAVVPGYLRNLPYMDTKLSPEALEAFKLTIENSITEKAFRGFFPSREILRLNDPEWSKRCVEKLFGPKIAQVKTDELTPEELTLASQIAKLSVMSAPDYMHQERLENQRRRKEELIKKTEKKPKTSKPPKTEFPSHNSVKITPDTEKGKLALSQFMEDISPSKSIISEEKWWEDTPIDQEVEKASILEEVEREMDSLKEGFFNHFKTLSIFAIP